MDVRLCVVPYDSGREGWRMGAGPDALLAAGLVDALADDGAAVTVERVHPPAGSARAEIRTAFELARAVAAQVAAARRGGAFPLVLAGNCNSALGTVSALGGRPGVLWLDAHADLNTPDTTAGGMLDGMALATLTGRCWATVAATVPGFAPLPDDRVAIVGGRDLDPGERALLDRGTVARAGPGDPAARARVLDAIAARADAFYLHVDLDVLDPTVAVINGFAAPGGLTLPEVGDWVDGAAARRPLAAAALTALDPGSDPSGAGVRAGIAVARRLVRAAGRGTAVPAGERF